MRVCELTARPPTLLAYAVVAPQELPLKVPQLGKRRQLEGADDCSRWSAALPPAESNLFDLLLAKAPALQGHRLRRAPAYAAAQLTSPPGAPIGGAGVFPFREQQWDDLNVNRGKTEGWLFGLRTAAEVAVLAGAVGSVGFLLRATNRNPSQLLVVLLAIWVVSPFVALLWANIAAKRWPVLTRVTLYGMMLVVPLSSLAIYVADALWPRNSQGAFVFIVVPPASWLLSGIVVLIAAFISDGRSRRADGV
jgi:hypothetical protein